MIANLPTYDEARKAIRDGNDPVAYLHLGIIYANGIGTTPNHVLANYFYEKALALGCDEAENYINKEYEQGARNIVKEVEFAARNIKTIAPDKLERLKKQLDRERVKKNYGHLSQLREHLPLFYPKYSQRKAIKDIVEGRDTVDADIYYALNFYHNRYEVNVEVLDSFMEQLFSPITNDQKLYQRIIKRNNENILMEDEREFMLQPPQLSSSYKNICRTYGVEHQEFFRLKATDIYPFIKPSTASLIVRQAFRCLLTIRKTDTKIFKEVFENLDKDMKMVDICENMTDMDLQLFLIIYVELGIDLEALGAIDSSLLKAYLRNDLTVLASHLNAFAERLRSVGIKHHLPIFTPDNLPEIRL